MSKAVQKRLDKLVESMDPRNDYYLALGRFVSAFSRVESTLLAVLIQVAELDRPTGQAILSGTRIETAMSYISRIGEAEKWHPRRRKQFKNVFSHLGAINKLRNDLMHYGASPLKPGQFKLWKVTNKRVAHARRSIRSHVISTTKLQEATTDLYMIEQHLVYLGYKQFIRRDALASWRRALRASWHYKPATQSRRRRKRRARREARPPQPRASSQ